MVKMLVFNEGIVPASVLRMPESVLVSNVAMQGEGPEHLPYRYEKMRLFSK
jgi:hypothetical protein